MLYWFQELPCQAVEGAELPNTTKPTKGYASKLFILSVDTKLGL